MNTTRARHRQSPIFFIVIGRDFAAVVDEPERVVFTIRPGIVTRGERAANRIGCNDMAAQQQSVPTPGPA